MECFFNLHISPGGMELFGQFCLALICRPPLQLSTVFPDHAPLLQQSGHVELQFAMSRTQLLYLDTLDSG